MITNLYIIDQGISLYSYKVSEKTLINEHLFTGYLSAFGTFAQESFKHGLHSIQIKNGQKLIFYLESKFGLLFCAMAHERDNDYILQKLLSKIANSFILRFQSKLQSEERHVVKEYESFHDQLIDILVDKGYPRDIKALTKGLGFSTVLFFAGILILYSILTGLVNLEYITLITSVNIFVLVWIIITAITAAISGYIAGDIKLGSINGIIFFIILSTLVYFFVQIYFINYLFISYIVLIICWTMGFTGGYFGDRRKLYPYAELNIE